METIIVKIKCNPKYSFCNQLRKQGLLFDTLRQALGVDDEGLQEITFEEYEFLGRNNNSKIYDKS